MARSSSKVIVQSKDVLSGTGKRCFLHPGNQRFHMAIAQHFETYVSAKRMNKTLIIKKLAAHIYASGSRFLKKARTLESGTT